jgi:flavin reductase (DIM6/NTAB) family NADH-FMN oxidoreductase RutF
MSTLHFSHDNILAFDKRYRANFINSLGGFKSLGLIGTVNTAGQTNLAVFNSFFHLGAHPPLFGFIIRPDSVDRHTLSNIEAIGEFTVNQVTEAFFKKAHQTSARYPQDISEFDATGLTPLFNQASKAPFVQESHIQIAASLAERINLAINGTILMIGKIEAVFLPEDCLGSDGFIDLEKAGTIACSGLDSYHTTSRLARLPYAKPEQPIG